MDFNQPQEQAGFRKGFFTVEQLITTSVSRFPKGIRYNQSQVLMESSADSRSRNKNNKNFASCV